MNERARACWARTRLHPWPGPLVLAGLPPELLPEAADTVARAGASFAALVLEKDEVSLTLPADLWEASPLRASRTGEAGPYRAITLDLVLDLDLCGYLAPAAALLAEAGISVVPQCAFGKDHLLVREERFPDALRLLEELIARCAAASG